MCIEGHYSNLCRNQEKINYKTLNSLVPVDVIYMDLQRAFDSVPHKHLLYKIEHYGNLLRWIDGFLSNRRQRVVLNGGKSCWQDVKSGVPRDPPIMLA